MANWRAGSKVQREGAEDGLVLDAQLWTLGSSNPPLKFRPQSSGEKTLLGKFAASNLRPDNGTRLFKIDNALLGRKTTITCLRTSAVEYRFGDLNRENIVKGPAHGQTIGTRIK
jgi:hypothetical protein